MELERAKFYRLHVANILVRADENVTGWLGQRAATEGAQE